MTDITINAAFDSGNIEVLAIAGAVDTLREDGVLDQINQEWLAQQGAPELS